ncbi:DsbC family protein [Neisseria weaveri]|uniref:DsbC family protein n=1 Tax=Neisseria weaveri TaxID=28091 RepID=UPI000D320B3B|nr:DsbC family protein [Neisseria weaveri]
MKIKFLNTLLFLALTPLIACSQPSSAAQHTPTDSNTSTELTAKLEKVYAEQNLKVLSVHNSPINGLYEVTVSGNQIVYVDAKAEHMLVGDLIHIQSRESLTDKRVAELNRIDFSSLPLDKAIKEVRGNGKLKVAVFSDPDCPYCKRLEGEFAKMTDITIYSFMMPIASLHPDGLRKAVQIWCQPDRTTAWIEWMRKGKMPKQTGECDHPVEETVSLGEQLGFHGTPTLVFPNGRTQGGYSPLPQLKQTIEQNQ